MAPLLRGGKSNAGAVYLHVTSKARLTPSGGGAYTPDKNLMTQVGAGGFGCLSWALMRNHLYSGLQQIAHFTEPEQVCRWQLHTDSGMSNESKQSIAALRPTEFSSTIGRQPHCR